MVSVDRPGVSVEAVKWADRSDAVVVRLCEVWGSRGPVRVTLHRPFVSVSAPICSNAWCPRWSATTVTSSSSSGPSSSSRWPSTWAEPFCLGGEQPGKIKSTQDSGSNHVCRFKIGLGRGQGAAHPRHRTPQPPTDRGRPTGPRRPQDERHRAAPPHPRSRTEGTHGSEGAGALGAWVKCGAPSPYRILFESRPLFPELQGATNRAVAQGHDGVGFLWVRE